MKTMPRRNPRTLLALQAETAADLMTENPVSINAEASVKEAAALFTDRGFSGAPVIDNAGRPIGVISQADIVVHDREKVEYVPSGSADEESELRTATREPLSSGFRVESVDRARVRDIMTPAVFSVAPETPAAKVIEEMMSLKVHRLFVVRDDGVLVGVISAFDIVSRLAANR